MASAAAPAGPDRSRLAGIGAPHAGPAVVDLAVPPRTSFCLGRPAEDDAGGRAQGLETARRSRRPCARPPSPPSAGSMSERGQSQVRSVFRDARARLVVAGVASGGTLVFP